MKVLVTGGNGFIGSYLLEALKNRGYEIRCIVRRTSNLQFIEHLDVELRYGSLSDLLFLRETLEGVDIVYHLAGTTRAYRRDEYYRVNTENTGVLLEACARHDSAAPLFIYVSSLAAAGPSTSQHMRTELETPEPISDYGKSKWRAEKLVHLYMKTAPAVIIRPPVVYGPRDSDVLKFFKWIKRGICPLLGFGQQRVSIVHVFDLVEGLLLAAEKKQAVKGTYFICNDTAERWDFFADVAAAQLARRVIRVRVPVFTLYAAALFSELVSRMTRRPALINLDKAREMRFPHWICSNARARDELGYVQNISLQEGVGKTVQWYLQNGWL